jgi:L-arabinose transport system ATP-binding protein
MAAANHYLQFRQISKVFPGVKALQDVSFGVGEGSVHALLGENGAGKSTLLKSLSGAHQPSSGEIVIGGVQRIFKNTSAAIDAGVAVIYQELHMVPEMTVAENLLLGQLPNTLGIVNRRKAKELAMEHLARLGENILPSTKLGLLSIAQQQMIEIAKALSRGAKVIAFDEPTSSLSAREIQRLFQIIRQLQRENHVILYVTHRMEEVYELCDSATVLRDGRHVSTWESMKGVTPDTIVKQMVGREIADIYNYSTRSQGSSALRVDRMMGPGVNEPISLDVKAGEIVGLFGLVGAGRSELLKLIYGAVKHKTGKVSVCGAPIAIDKPADAIRAGLVFCPEDRKKEGIIPIRSVMENLNISARRNTAKFGLVIDERWERENAEDYIQRLAVKTPSPKQLIMNLSGGNQQKVILARWLSEKVNVILFDEPTRGIDVGAKSEIYNIIYSLARQGVGVLVVSSDLPEVLGICDRVLVMRQGRLAGELSRAEATSERAMKLALPISN